MLQELYGQEAGREVSADLWHLLEDLVESADAFFDFGAHPDVDVADFLGTVLEGLYDFVEELVDAHSG